MSALTARSRRWSAMKNVIAALVCLLASGEVLATLLQPDEEFELAATVEAPVQIVALVAPSLEAMGFSMAGELRETIDGRFRAMFGRGDKTEVILIGRPACVHVGIFTSGEKQLAQQLRHSLVGRLRLQGASLRLFEASGCEKPL